jgi:hypothetical protein
LPEPANGYTLIWQAPRAAERAWITELFRDCFREERDDSHSVVIDNSVVIDARIQRAPEDYYARFASKRNVFLFHLGDEWYDPHYEKYSNFNGVFRNYASSAFNPSFVMGLPLGYYNFRPHASEIPTAKNRKYVWCFLGQLNKASRPEMASALARIGPNLVYATDNPGSPRFTVETYHRALFDSVFVPCPMGNVNLESFRVYESLECGAIPILESRLTLDYFRLTLGDHPLPTFRSWNAAARYIRHLMADSTLLLAKQEECLAWWQGYKVGLKGQVREFLRSRAGAAKIGSAGIRGYQRFPGWRSLELIRHHSGRAIVRRIVKEGKRLTGRGDVEH